MARADIGKMHGTEELARFVKRVEEMRSQGLRTWAIADALGVPKTTINDRLRRWREMSSEAL